MEKVLLSIIAASGLSAAVSSHVERRYHFGYEQKNMTEAQSYCRDKYTDLATVDNMEVLRILNNMVYLSDMSAWIGLYNDVDGWRWSLSDRSFYKHRETEFRLWGHRQPDNYLSGEYCAGMYPDGRWNDARCDGLLKAVCLDVRGPNVTFVLTKNSMNWTEAQSYCRENHTDLASVRNMAENQEVQDLLPAGQAVWIGLFRDSWKWSDGSDSSFRNWRTTEGEPNNNYGKEACVVAVFSDSGKWEDWNCDIKTAFICHSLVSTKRVIKLSVMKKNSSLDLNDADVMEEMLKELKQRLKNQGVNEDIKLSWKKQSDGKVFH